MRNRGQSRFFDPVTSVKSTPTPVLAEGLIGFKLQAYVNNPKRTQDIEDIRSLLRANHHSLNMDEVRGYFRLFEREALLDEIKTNIDG